MFGFSRLNNPAGIPPYGPVFVSGRFYDVGDLCGYAVPGRVTASAWLKDVIYTVAFPVYQRMHIASLNVRTNSTHTATTAKVLIGIYADNNGVPGTKILTSSELTMAASSTTYSSAHDFWLEPGLYWLAFVSSHSDSDGNKLIGLAPPANPTQAVGLNLGQTTATNVSASSFNVTANRAYDSTLPASHPAPTYPTTGLNTPCVWIGV